MLRAGPGSGEWSRMFALAMSMVGACGRHLSSRSSLSPRESGGPFRSPAIRCRREAEGSALVMASEYQRHGPVGQRKASALHSDKGNSATDERDDAARGCPLPTHCGHSWALAASVVRPEDPMKLPIRNRSALPLTLFIEPYCDQHEIPPDGEAIVTLADGYPHSMDFHPENWVSLWDEGGTQAIVEVVTKEQNAVIDALAFARVWLFRYGGRGKAAAKDLDAAVDREERASGYLRSRCAAYKAFRAGFQAKDAQPDEPALPKWTGSETLVDAYRAGVAAAHFNQRTRLDPGLIELGEAPFDTDVARRKFDEADAVTG